MQHLDGVEFDLRLTTDDQLVLHHDRKVALESERLEGRPPHPEEWAIDELKDVGFDGFEDLLDDSTFMDHWRSGSKTVCIELKRPHPRWSDRLAQWPSYHRPSRQDLATSG